MGNVAASGGYYLAVAGDEIYANDMTITGSIGVFATVLILKVLPILLASMYNMLKPTKTL